MKLESREVNVPRQIDDGYFTYISNRAYHFNYFTFGSVRSNNKRKTTATKSRDTMRFEWIAYRAEEMVDLKDE